MKQHMRGLASDKVRTGTVLAALALVASIAISLFLFQPAHALPLVNTDRVLQTVTEPVGQLLQPNQPPQRTAEPPRQAVTPAKSPPRANAAPSSSHSSSPQAAATAPVSPRTSGVKTTPVAQSTPEPLRTVTPITVDKSPSRDMTFFSDVSRFSSVQSMSKLPISSPASVPLQATGAGWRVYGMMWYWWFLIGLIVYATIYAGRQLSRAPVR